MSPLPFNCSSTAVVDAVRSPFFQTQLRVLYGCRWRSIEEFEVGIGVHHIFSYLTLGPFDYPIYLLPVSENSGYIAISVSFGFSQSGCGWTSYS